MLKWLSFDLGIKKEMSQLFICVIWFHVNIVVMYVTFHLKIKIWDICLTYVYNKFSKTIFKCVFSRSKYGLSDFYHLKHMFMLKIFIFFWKSIAKSFRLFSYDIWIRYTSAIHSRWTRSTYHAPPWLYNIWFVWCTMVYT